MWHSLYKFSDLITVTRLPGPNNLNSESRAGLELRFEQPGHQFWPVARLQKGHFTNIVPKYPPIEVSIVSDTMIIYSKTACKVSNQRRKTGPRRGHPPQEGGRERCSPGERTAHRTAVQRDKWSRIDAPLEYKLPGRSTDAFVGNTDHPRSAARALLAQTPAC